MSEPQRMVRFCRHGNNVIQTLNAIAFCIKLRCRLLTNAMPPFFSELAFDFGDNPAPLAPNFFYQGFHISHDERRDLAMRYLRRWMLVEPPPMDDDTIVLAMRSGDIMQADPPPHNSFVQPPTAFWERAVKDSGCAKVVIVTEPDFANPCITLIRDEFNAGLRANGVIDFATLVGARHLAMGFSSFASAATYLAPTGQTVYLPDTNCFQEFGRPALPSYCRLRKYWLSGYTPRLTWKASPDQLQSMISFPDSGVNEVDTFTD